MKKVYIKKFICITLILTLIFSVFACAKKPDKNIVIALPMGSEKTIWEALAKDYMQINPDTLVQVKDKDAAEYSSWLINNFATGQNIEADIITVNEISSYIPEGKVLKLDGYLNKINPYMTEESGEKKRWKDGLNADAYFSSLDNKFLSQDNSTYCISPDRVQVAIFYNKKIFEMCGIEVLPKTWDELVAVCEVITKFSNPESNEKFVPIAIPGDIRALSYYFNWLLRIYSDQYFRDLEPQVAFQKGDYYFDEERDGEWIFDIDDINNDKTMNIGFNTVRLAAQVNFGGALSVMSDKYKELMVNINKLVPKYAMPGFTSAGMGQEYYYFYNAAAAMILDASWFVTDFPEKMKKPYQTGFKQFDYGVIYMPPMGMEQSEGGELVKINGSKIGAKTTRSLGGAAGYYGVVKKSKAQNDINADFLMYFASPRGQQVRLAAMKTKGLAPKGENLIVGVKMDEEWDNALAKIEYRGECDYNPATVFSAGWMGDGESKRVFYSEIQKYLTGSSLDSALNNIHIGIQGGIGRWITANNYKSDCLNYPERNPNA